MNEKNEIKVFLNVCRHRGMILIKKAKKIEGAIRCPYHSWCYSKSGDLISTPHVGGPGKNLHNGINKKDLGLLEIKSYIWQNIIWVNINGNAPNFEEHMSVAISRWSEFNQKQYHGGRDSKFKLKLKCNWKLAVENYCESYHLPWVHPGLNSYSKIDDHYHIQGLPNRFAGQGTIVYNPRFKGKEKFPCFPNWPKDKENIAEYVALFPNVMLGIHKDHFYAYWLEPINSEYTKEHMEIYYVGNEAANSKKFKSLRKQNFELWKGVQSEDLNIIEGMQDGRKSPSYNGGNFSPVMDNPTHHFHKWVANTLMR